MNKLMHGPNVAGQSIVDRVMAAKHTVAGQSLQKVIGKATTEEVLGPKRKHLDYLLQCTNEPNVSIPQMANLLIERTLSTNWVVVFKSLVTAHNLLNYGNERFTQYLASNNCSFNLANFMDKTGNQGYDMSTFIRRYSKYLNEKAISYRLMAFDFCKVKRGKEDGLLRTMSTDKLLKTLPVLQAQLDALLEFDATPNELSNGVINAAFMLMFKDLIRLFACYNDGIINLLEKYFEMNKKNCREALDVYKKFLARMDRVCEFLKVAESVGIDKGDIPDLAKAPSSLLDALEQHLTSLENCKKSGVTVVSKPAAGVSAVISSYAAASQVGTAPGAGSGVTQISEEERTRILEEEQRQLDQMKQQRLKQMAATGGTAVGGSPISSASSTSNASANAPAAAAAAAKFHAPGGGTNGAAAPSSTIVMTTNTSPSKSPLGGGSSPRGPGAPSAAQQRHSDDLFALGASGGAFSAGGQSAMFTGNGTAYHPAGGGGGNPFAVMGGAPQGGAAWGSPVYAGSGMVAQQQQLQYNSGFATDANFASAFGTTAVSQQHSGFDGHGEILKPLQPMAGGGGLEGRGQGMTQQEKLMKQDLDGSLASLAGSLSIRPTGQQTKKTEHLWSAPVNEKRLTGASGPAWAQQPGAQAAPWGQAQPGAATPWTQPQPTMNVVWGQGMPGYHAGSMGQPMPMMMGQAGIPMAQPNTIGAYPVSMGLSGAQPAMGWGVSPQQQQVMFGQQQFSAAQQQQQQAPQDPFGAL